VYTIDTLAVAPVYAVYQCLVDSSA